MMSFPPFGNDPILNFILKIINIFEFLIGPLFFVIEFVWKKVVWVYIAYDVMIHNFIFLFKHSEHFYSVKLKKKPHLIHIIKNPTLDMFKSAIAGDEELFKHFEDEISYHWKFEALKSNIKVIQLSKKPTNKMLLYLIEYNDVNNSCGISWSNYLPDDLRQMEKEDIINELKARVESEEFNNFINQKDSF
jgi:hypothetical protein